MTVAHLLCDGLYLDGRTPDDPGQIADVGEAAGLGGPVLLERWGSAEGHEAVYREYVRARALGVTTYPSLFVRGAGSTQLVPVVAGFAPADAIVDGVRRAARGAAARQLG